MSVHVHRCERTDGLLRGLAEVLRPTPADPFTPDLVAVPTPGIERYLAQGLSLHLGTSGPGTDGVCANVEFPAPAELVQRVLAAAGPVPGQVDPWRPERATWPLLATIDAGGDQPWCGPLARHLGRDRGPGEPGDPRLDRRFAVASRLARLFDSYAGQRPSLLLEWVAGADTDGFGLPLPGDLLWQPELWRRLRAEIGLPSPAERLDAACAAVRADPRLVDLPDRLNVFGPSRLPADQLAVLAALATRRQVHLWLADASPALWDRLAGESAQPAAPGRRRADDPSESRVAHPLLRSLGRDARELRLRLTAPMADARGLDTHVAAPLADATLLGLLQAQLRDDVDPAAAGRAAPGQPTVRIDPADRSLQVHACHGPARQAEVLREVVLGLLQADPTLQPRDILVMCADLPTFAPLVSAAFSDPRPGPADLREGRPGPRAGLADLRLRIADRTPEQANDVLAALEALLDLAAGRMPRSEVLDLVARAPVRTRFGLDESDVERVEQLAVRAGVRWGLDARTRAEHGLAGLVTGTWQWGVDRMLVGAALSEDDLPLLGGTLPLDDVQGGDVTRIAALAELLERVRTFRDGTRGRHPMAHWVDLLQAAVTGLLAARGPDAWQVGHALAAIAGLAEAAGEHAEDVVLRLAEVRWMLRAVLAGRPTRSNFRSGGLTVCGLVPMRSVPHRVICLVGMDDGVFPRAVVPDGDDVLARDPRIGERDPRSEDRQLLLDAIMAAVDHLVITYTGADDRTNEPRPPCVPLGELLDTLDATARTSDGRPARAHVLVRHPLQPFDPRTFTAGALVPGVPFGHDPEALAAARATTRPRTPAAPLLAAALPTDPVGVLTLADLVRFLRSPAKAFLRTRIGLDVRAPGRAALDALPLDLDGLARWDIGERVMRLLARGTPAQVVRDAEQARGTLPPGALARPELSGIGQAAEALAGQLHDARGGPARQVAIRVDLPSGRRITGAVDDVHGSAIVRGTYSRPQPKHGLSVWPELLALAVAEPQTQWEAVVLGRGDPWRLRAPEAPLAAGLLDALVDLFDAGMAAPLPLPVATGHAYAERRHRPNRIATALAVAERQWSRTGQGQAPTGECAEPENVLLYGEGAPFTALLAEPPWPDESCYPEEGSRFAVLARRLWEPILVARGAAS